MEKRRKASKRKIVEKLDDLPLEDLSKRIIVAWESMAPRFDVVLVPCPWFITAVQEFANSCKSSSKRMLDLGFYDRHTGELTELGKKNWDALYRSAVSPDEPFRSALAIMGGRNKAPTCPPCINCIPNEMVAEILNHAFESHREVDGNTRNVVIGQGLPGLATANKWLHENSLSWISRQAVTIRVRSWPPKGFREGHLPVQFLQTVRKVHFDLDGLSYSDRKVIHPAMRQLAKIWTEKDELQSLTLSVGPDYEKLLLENPRLQFDADMKNAFSPLSGIPGNKLHYVFDFRAPVVPYGANALCAIAALREDSSSEKCLQFILEKSKDLINTPSGTYGCVPLHYAAQSIGDRSARRLLAMKGIDVNYKNDKDHTPLHEALTTCNARMMILLADNEKIIITEELVVDTVNRLSRTDVLTALYRRMENPPSWLERISFLEDFLENFQGQGHDIVTLCRKRHFWAQ
ncbi:hypothetical protein Q7P37_009918 [Cladosporium fusiforme]